MDLLRDLEDLDGDSNSEEQEEQEEVPIQEDATLALLESVKNADQITHIAKLSSSKHYSDVLTKVEQVAGIVKEVSYGPVEEDPEYSLIVEANNLASEMDNEILLAHKFIRDHYAPKFSELESLIPNPLEYARTVKLIGNEMDMSNLDLKSHLPSATVMVISVTATTTNGRLLNTQELARVFEACDMVIELETGRKKIIDYVESRMNFMAPNLTVILGSSTAAKIMGVAGGLGNLSRIPACNIMVLGVNRKTNLGMSSVTQQKHAGLVYQCELVRTTPPDFRRKAARVISAKVALAARVDCARESRDGTLGQRFRDEITRKIDLMLQPPPGKSSKALPIPDEGPKKRRGGKKARKAKERNGTTELQKAQNRMSFGVAEAEVGFGSDETVGLGMLGQEQSGKLRLQADARHKIGLSKKYANKSYTQSNVSGLSSSVSFTPIKGIELENPEAAAARVKKANDKYFSGGFFKKKQ